MEASSGTSSSQPQKSRKRGDRKLKSTITTGSKKERWLLTRKTWRYMTDAVGNLLPVPITPTPPTASDNKSPLVLSSDHSLSSTDTTVASTSQCKSTVGTQSTIECQQQVDFYSGDETKNIAVGERQFHQSCSNQSQYLIWTRTKATRIAGPASRQDKINKEARGGGDCPLEESVQVGEHILENTDCFSTEGDEEVLVDDDVEMEGDEYDEYDEEQVTVREGRKSSLASSISSVISGLSFFRSTTATSASDPSIGSTAGELCSIKEKTFVSIGIQTEPFPEETLNRLRRQCFLQDTTSPPDSFSKFQSPTGGIQGLGEDPYVSPEGSHGPQSGGLPPFPTSLPASPSSSLEQQGGGEGGEQYKESTGKESCNIFGSSSTHGPSESSEGGDVRSVVQVPSSSTPSTAGDPDKKSEESGYSSSISDTVMRYLRMVRKNSKVDKSDMDRFKTVNYDRSLRNIKSKNVSIEEALEHEKNKQLAAQNKTASELSTEFSCAITSSNLEKLQEEYSNRMSSNPSDLTLNEKSSQRSGVGKLPGTGRILPSVGIQAGESLVRFLKLFKYRKCSDFSSKSFGSSESPVDPPTSPRCSLATTIISSSGSDNEFFYQSQQSRPSPRTSFDNNSQSTFDEPQEFENDVFTHFSANSTSQYQYQSHQLFSSSSYQPSSPYSYHSAGQLNLSYPQTVIIGATQSSRKFPIFSPPSSDPSPQHPHHHHSSSYPVSTTSIPSSNLSQSQQQQQQSVGYGSSSVANRLSSTLSHNSPPLSSFSGGSERKPSSFSQQSHDSGKGSHLVGISETSNSPTDWSSVTMSAGEKSGQPYQAFIRSLFSSRKNVAGHARSTTTTGETPVQSHPESSSKVGDSSRTGNVDTRVASSSLVSTAGTSSSSSRSRVGDQSSREIMSHKETGQKGSGGSGSSSRGGNMMQGLCPEIPHENPAHANIHFCDYIDPSFAVMQKSKSSSSVLQQSSSSTSGYSSGGNRLISKAKLFKSKKQPEVCRSPTPWPSPSQVKQGKWTTLLNSRQISLEPTTVHNLIEIERVALQKVALCNLQSLHLGVEVKIPREKTGTSGSKPKRRPYLLKKKALSTGFFDSKREESGGKESLVFAVSLTQCVKNDQEKRLKTTVRPGTPPTTWGEYTQDDKQKSHHSSRLSVSSDIPAKEDKGICGSIESLFWPDKKSSGSFNQLFTGGSNNDISSEEDSFLTYGQVPEFVVACVRHLETFGLNTVGIFRVSSSMKRIRQLREDIDGGKEIHFGRDCNPHDIATLLKEYLRDLPEPLLCRDLYEAFLGTQRIRNRKLQLESMQYLIDLLPVANRDTLYALLSLFSKVVDNSQDRRDKNGQLLTGNKMEAYSLATLIAPNILPCMPMDASLLQTGEQQAILTKERRDSIDIVNYMITNYRELFFVSSETLYQMYMELQETHPEAVENILRSKFPAAAQETEDVDTASSVFDGGSECGEEEVPSRIQLLRREEILHEGGGKGGGETRSDGGRIKMEIGNTSGGESDSSSTKSTSRWFRKCKVPSNDQKNRASSDSGSDKVKTSRKKKDVVVESMEEAKRLLSTSLDSVNLKDTPGTSSSLGTGSAPGRAGVESKTVTKIASGDRQRSSSDQGLKIPMDMSRRQSSPLLESSRSVAGGVGSGVIRASLKITMPLKGDDAPPKVCGLNWSDTDIPFIEEDNSEAHAYPMTSSGDQGTSPVDDLSATFPYQEIQARICLGGLSSKESPCTTAITSSTSHRSGSSPKAHSSRLSRHDTSKGTTSPQLSSSLLHVTMSPQHLTVPGQIVGSQLASLYEPKGLGKETKGANIGGLGLIKSKTADFEKLAKRSISSGTSRGIQTSVPRERTRRSTTPKGTMGVGLSDEAGGQGGSQGTVISLCKSSSDLPAAASPASSQGTAVGGTWKRSEIIASPSAKAKKHETFL